MTSKAMSCYLLVRLAMITSLLILSAFAQTQATFEFREYSVAANIIQQVHLNKDGVPDFITGSGQPGKFAVSLSNADGSYQPWVYYSTVNQEPYNSFAVGDFNNDGNADLIVGIQGGNATPGYDVFLGNGDGTLRAPVKHTSATPLSIAVADFNHDGKQDFAFINLSAPFDVRIAYGRGDGTFASPVAVYSAQMGTPYALLAGDFDGDQNADLYFEDPICTSPSNCGVNNNVRVLYGNGAGAFSPLVFTAPNATQYDVLDVNSDGKSDVAISRPNEVELRLGSSNRTLTVQHVSLGSAVENPFGNPHVSAADFNGDGLEDLATLGVEVSSAQDVELIVLPRKSDGTYGAPQRTAFAQNRNLPFGTYVGDYNRDGKPDVATSEDFNPGGELHILLNTTTGGTFPRCVAPSDHGIKICSPANGSTSTSSTVRFSVGARSFLPLRKVELWVDGIKKKQSFYTYAYDGFLDSSFTFAAGTHRADLFAVNFDGMKQLKTIHFTVPTFCSAPTTDGIHVCSPVNGASYTSPVPVSATAKVSGTLYRFELWVDGVKKVSQSTAQMNTSLALPSGTHRFAFVARNTGTERVVTTVVASVK